MNLIKVLLSIKCMNFIFIILSVISNTSILFAFQKVIDDFPPGGFPEYFTEVKAPGPA